MHFTPLDKQQRAEWRGMLNPADGAHIGAAAALFFLSALVIPLSYIEAVSGLYLLYAAVFYYMLTHSAGSLIAIALPGVALFAVSGFAPGLPSLYTLPAVYAALVLGGIGGGFLLIHCRERRYLALLALPVAAFAIACAVAGPLAALLVLIPTALSLVLGHAMCNCRPQTPVLVTLGGVLAASGVIAYLIWYAAKGWPEANPFAYLGELVRAGIARVLDEAAALYAQQGVELALSATDVHNVGALLGNTLVGFFLAACGVLAFLIFRTYLRVLTAWNTLSRVPLRIGAMTVSPIAAGLFLFSYIAGAFASGGVFGTVCENLSIVLQPALVLVGVGALMGKPGGKRSKFSTALLIVALLLLFNYPSLALLLAATVGAIRILLAAFAMRGKREDNK